MSDDTLRIDKWLWHARFFKSRTLAGRFCNEGRVRVNGVRVSKAHSLLKPGDVLTFPLGPHIRVVKIIELGTRRGPAVEARTLYEDLSPPTVREKDDGPSALASPVAARERGAGRPTKRDRRVLDRFRDGE